MKNSERRRLNQRGISLIETLVALGLFAMTAATMGKFMVTQIRMASTNHLHTKALAMAAEQLETTRALLFNDMVSGSKTKAVGGVTFTVQTTGAPQKITVDGSPPANVTFTDNGNGTATFAGTPPSGARGTYTLTLKATADDTSTTQSFTLEVQPKVTALGPATAWIGVNNSDDVGLSVDLRAEVFLKAGTTVTRIGEGELDNQTTGSSGFTNAGLKSIPIGLIGDAAVVRPGSELQYKLSVRRSTSSAAFVLARVVAAQS